MNPIGGRYFDGVTSRIVSAKLFADQQLWTLQFDDLTKVSFSASDVKISDRIGNTPRRVTWGTAESFVTDNNDLVDSLATQVEVVDTSLISRGVHWLEQRWIVAIVSLSLLIAVVTVSAIWGIPYGARVLAQQIPDSVSKSIGDRAFASIDDDWLEPSEMQPERQQQLRDYFKAHSNIVRRVEFRHGGAMGANAFALPSGIVLFTDEIVAATEHDEELLAVFLHEAGHVAHRHSETMIIQDSAWLVLLTMISGDISGVSEALYSLPVLLGQMSFSRDLEQEADDYSIEMLRQHQLSPNFLADALLALEATHFGVDEHAENPDDTETDVLDWLDYLSTHPATKDRIARIRRAAASSAQ